MKTNILVTGLVLATVGAVLLYPTIRGNADRHAATAQSSSRPSLRNASRSCSSSTRRAAWAG